MTQSTLVSKSSTPAAVPGLPTTLTAMLSGLWAATPAAIFFKAVSDARKSR